MEVAASSCSLLDASFDASFGDASGGGNSILCIALELCLRDSLAGEGSSMVGVGSALATE